jgi:cobalamin biosynthesis protein CobD/CbiB
MAEEKRWPRRCTGFIVLMVAIEIAFACLWILQYLQTGIATWDFVLILAMAVATIGLAFLVRIAPSIKDEKTAVKWAIGIYGLMITIGTVALCVWTLRYLQTGTITVGVPWLLAFGLSLVLIPLPWLYKAAKRLAKSLKTSPGEARQGVR